MNDQAAYERIHNEHMEMVNRYKTYGLKLWVAVLAGIIIYLAR